MKLSQQSQSVIESAIRKAIGKFACGCEQTIVTDIHIQPNQNSGELCIFDEERETIAELLLVDDDTLLVNDELLKGLDQELDAFLKELLEK